MSHLDDILGSLIVPDDDSFSIELAQHVLRMQFSEAQAARYELLAEKNQAGALTPQEHQELEAFVTANTLLMIFKSKARRAMVKRSSAA